ncbi:kinase-like domain-containing protein, partial [Boletus edulis]
KMKRELGIWRRLEPHPNIVPLLGKVRGDEFASDYPCMVSMLMPHGTLSEYVSRCDTPLPLSKRIRLVSESLHSKDIVHGDFHPGNILIDRNHNPRVTDFGFSQTLTRQDELTYLFTHSIRPGAKMWVAPELSRPDLFDDLKFEATLSSDIYSLGSIILFTLSGKLPWDKAEFESQLEQLNNPPRPLWPIIPDVAWEFIERCWSPRVPKNRPSAQEVLSFTTDRLEKLLQPK